MIHRALMVLLVHCLYLNSKAQDSVSFSFEEFISQVKTNHPIMQRASNAVKLASADLLKARGSFDPKISHETHEKNFNDKEYYQLSNTALKIPTWFGVELKGGYEQNRGDFISGENQTPGSGLWYGGIAVPIGKNLFIDERRKILRQAKIMREQSELEQRMIVSDLVLHASQAYWDWYQAFHALKINLLGIELAEQRLEAVKISANLGEHAKIDTLEATLMKNYRKLELEQSKADLTYYKALLEIYLWGTDEVPLELAENAFPPKISLTPFIYHNISADSTLWVSNYDYKLEYLSIEERYRKEMLKPELDVVYNPLLQPTGNGFIPFSASNMKFGLTASMPIFLRKERGELNAVKVKQYNTVIDQEIKRRELENKIGAIRAVCQNLENQYVIQNEVILASKEMRDAELIKFDLGESSLFLVNTREMKFLESLQKQIDLTKKLFIYRSQYIWLTAI
jgi:outer membrane protein TolC